MSKGSRNRTADHEAFRSSPLWDKKIIMKAKLKMEQMGCPKGSEVEVVEKGERVSQVRTSAETIVVVPNEVLDFPAEAEADPLDVPEMPVQPNPDLTDAEEEVSYDLTEDLEDGGDGGDGGYGEDEEVGQTEPTE